MPSVDPKRQTLPVPTFDAPGGFAEDEVTAVWGPRVDPTLRDPRMLQKQVASRPSFVAQTRRVEGGLSLSRLVAEVIRDLADSIPGLAPVVPSDVTFDDGAQGILLELAFSLEPGFDVNQLQVARLDRDIFTTLTFSIDRPSWSSKLRAERLKQLLSLKLNH